MHMMWRILEKFKKSIFSSTCSSVKSQFLVAENVFKNKNNLKSDSLVLLIAQKHFFIHDLPGGRPVLGASFLVD
jgi:hypothetical protein